MDEPQPLERRAWFGPRRVGYGAGPRTWQGWLVILAIPAEALVLLLLVLLVVGVARGVLG